LRYKIYSYLFDNLKLNGYLCSIFIYRIEVTLNCRSTKSIMENIVDISENTIYKMFPQVLETLLKDHTTQKPIFWATESYASMGDGYHFFDAITPEKIIGENGLIIRPRSVKTKEEQAGRTKEMAEVFTPSWVCNAQNNLVDEAWFGRQNVFNVEYPEEKRWESTQAPIVFPEGKTWKDYVRATRMEITCGEAPYLVSRYDTTTGEFIPLQERIGLLDRKLRVISENTKTSSEWLSMAQEAYKNIYAYEWQGDNLLLAREALLMSFIEYYEAKFGRRPLTKSINYIAYIISWNVWQMDGLKGVVPQSCRNNHKKTVKTLFGESNIIENCEGCQQDDIKRHNGKYCLIRDWGLRDLKTGENNRKIKFIDLIK
jgi:hypothetical protein